MRRAVPQIPGPQTEHALQGAVVGYLRLRLKKTGYAFAVPNAAKRSLSTARYMLAEGLTAGVADVCVLLKNGRTLWLELKTVNGRQSPQQRGFQNICEALGHDYVIVRSLDDVVRLINAMEPL